MNSTQTVTVPARAWFGDDDRTLTFPAGWDIHFCASQGAPALDSTQIAAAFDNPIGTPRIRDAARGRASAAVIVDDLGRPTPAAKMLPFVLEELAAAGVPKSETTIVVGCGSHRPLTQEEIAQKVGAETAAAYATTSHNFMAGDLVGYGSLEDGTPVYINRIVAEAEFKICVGGIYPHGAAGFGGGAKLIVPGVAGFATIFHFHSFSTRRGHGNIERKKAPQGESGDLTIIDGGVRDLRDVAEGVARHIGLDMVVNCVPHWAQADCRPVCRRFRRSATRRRLLRPARVRHPHPQQAAAGGRSAGLQRLPAGRGPDSGRQGALGRPLF